jgi:surface antigen
MSRYAVSFIAVASLLTLPALALADSWKNESGRGGDRTGYGYEESYDRGGHVKREWKSGNCKYEYKSGPKGVKEEYKCDRGVRYGGPPVWVPPGHRAGLYRTVYPQGPLDLAVGRCNREMIGQIVGGAMGGLAGAQIGGGNGRLAAVAGSTLLGFLIGGEIGRTLDQADRLCVDQVLEDVPDGRSIVWNGPRTNERYEVIPRETFETNDGRYCREYLATSTIGGKAVQTYGTACRQPDGSWRLANGQG